MQTSLSKVPSSTSTIYDGAQFAQRFKLPPSNTTTQNSRRGDFTRVPSSRRCRQWTSRPSESLVVAQGEA